MTTSMVQYTIRQVLCVSQYGLTQVYIIHRKIDNSMAAYSCPGVGFRPFINGQAARRPGLAGFVFNDSQGVTIEVEGTIEALDHFQRALREQAPPWRLSILLPARW